MDDSATHRESIPSRPFINGNWESGSGEHTRYNPAHPSQVASVTALADAAAVDRAVAAARAALPGWRNAKPIARAHVLRRAAEIMQARADTLAECITREEGKTLAESHGEIGRTVETLHYYASHAWIASGVRFDSTQPEETVHTRRVPVGVVAVITPWNFPLVIPAWKIAPALVYGNTVVFKPATHTPMIAAALVQILHEAGLPAGVLNLVPGDGDIGRAMTAHADIDAITFTGSSAVGWQIWSAATPRGVRVQLEMGGHNPLVVFPDADLDRAAQAAAAGAMFSAGQKCTATRRIIVHRSVYDAFVSRLTERVAALRVGDGMDPDSQISPLVSRQALDEVAAAVDDARKSGAKVLAGGEVLTGDRFDGGHFYAPTVLAVEHPDQVALCREEVFGPVTAVIAVDDDDAAFAEANAVSYGLSASVFTGSVRRARRAEEDIDAGMININTVTTGSELQAPFGGMKRSSTQAPREQGETARDFFTHLKTIYVVPGN